MTTKSKQPAQNLDPDEIYRAKWTQATREAYFNEHPENFAQPSNKGYPIKDASDVNDAARLAGHAENPDAVKRKIIEIAKRLGFSSALPDSWKEDMKDKKNAERAAPATETAVPADETIERGAAQAEDRQLYLPITRINPEKREVTLTATAERLDAYKTVIGFDASKEAFSKWRGNIREMHDSHKAVGRALSVEPKEDTKEIDVTLRVSRGAEDTWQKVLDGTLTGASIGAKNGKWSETTWEGQTVPFLERYDLVEVSLVDNPACPGCDVKIIRADGIASEVLADEDEAETESQANDKQQRNESQADIARAGARLSAETKAAMHMARDHAVNAAKSSMSTCGCDECIGMLNRVNQTDDNDGDMDANFLAQPAARAAIAEIVRGVLTDALRDQVAPMTSRVNALLARDAQRKDQTDITRRVDDLDAKIKEIKELCEKIADQPISGGPVLHGATIDKRLPTQGSATRSNASDAETIQRALDLGFAPPTDVKDQIKAAASLIRR